VVYDAIHNSPIILEGGIGVFPVECVYAAIEVKTSLSTDDIKQAAKAIRQLRDVAISKKYVEYGTIQVNGVSVVGEGEFSNGLAPRTFIFAVKSGLTKTKLIRELEAAAKANESHLHGVVVLNSDFFAAQNHIELGAYTFHVETDKVFARFCAQVLATLQSVAMFPASSRAYLGLSVPET